MDSSNLRRIVGSAAFVALTLTMSSGCGAPKQSTMERLLIKQKARIAATSRGVPTAAPIVLPLIEPAGPGSATD